MSTTTEEVSGEDALAALRRKLAERRAATAKQQEAQPAAQQQPADTVAPTVAPVVAGNVTPVVAEAAKVPAEAPTAKGVVSKAARDIVYFDLETVPDESRIDRFGFEPLPEVPPETPIEQCPSIESVIAMSLDDIKAKLPPLNPPDAWLDRLAAAEAQTKKPRAGLAKIIGDCRESRNARTTAEAARIKTMSVTPEMCRIAALGFAVGESEPVSLVVGVNGVTEEGILEVFWGLVRTATKLCGFNIIGFDLPVIYVRSRMLGVAATKLIDLKPWGNDVIDVMQARFSRTQAIRMKALAAMLEIDIPAGETDGGAVYGLMQSDEGRVQVAEYVASDIVVTRNLHHFYAGYYYPA